MGTSLVWTVPLEISIHALTRSATGPVRCSFVCELISIHALTRSATKRWRVYSRSLCNFNPRTHEECDLERVDSCANAQNFNPRTHEECDDEYKCKECLRYGFQSTHSRGVRHELGLHRSNVKNFNPRTHEECDIDDMCVGLLSSYFNPRTHEECDLLQH